MGAGRVTALVLVLVMSGCGRVDFTDVSDAHAPRSSQASHLAEVVALPDDGVLVITGNSLFDTTAMTLDGLSSMSQGRVFVASQSGGPELAVLAVDGFGLAPTGVLQVVGTRPLVIVANEISIDGVLDGAARLATPGCGGAVPAMGLGAGQPGMNGGLYDSAGAGGGFGGNGGAGGNHTCSFVAGGAAGPSHGDPALLVLVGGSGGGAGSPGSCAVVPGGAGGGAIQLTATTSITVGGSINVGGGGGSGGLFCNGNDGAAGSGGGSGGAIFLEAPRVDVAGVLAANGGAGGAGAGGGGPPGNAGSDATSSLAAAAGGTNSGGGGRGGDGGSRDAMAVAGGIGTCSGAAGAGGGAVGRIAIRATSSSSAGTVTPAAVMLAY